MIPGFVAHLWQSTLFVGAVWLLTLALRKNPARVRYSLWFIASAKFLIPFSLLVGLGTFVPWRAAAPAAETGWVAVAEQVRPLVTIPAVGAEVALTANGTNRASIALAAFVLWFCGFAAITICWAARWKRIGELRRRASPLRMCKSIEFAVPIMSAPGLVEPGVFGVFRPILLLPEGIGARLNEPQLEAILAHELCHVRRRDNLTATIHMAVQAVFWFHPLVWWLGARLVDERERACDEEVLRLGNRPQVYAAGILNICKLYVESPLACVSGVTGADLKKRIEAIMSSRAVLRLDLGRKIGLALAGAAALAVPFAVGIVDAPARGQSSDVAAQSTVITVPQFEVASVKLNRSGTIAFSMRPTPGGGIVYTNVTLRDCIQAAYGVRDDQLSGGPGWIGSERFDIMAKAASPVPDSQVMLMLRSLLADRFKLTIHRDTKTLPLYRLVVAKSGPKLHEVEPGETSIRGDRGKLTAQKISMRQLADFLARRLNSMVIDNTGLNAIFDVKLDWAPDTNEITGKPTFGGAEQHANTGLSLFTALQDQLGLKLQADKGPVGVVIIDKAEKPSEN